MDPKYVFFVLYLYYYFETSNAESITYISTERPVIRWFDKKYLKNITLYSRRLSREDPRHYVELYMNSLITIGNNIKLDFSFYQFLTNRYRPSFVEMHFRACDLMKSDVFFGDALRQAFGNKTCPYAPGEYDLKNMTVSYVPKGFPFTKGRIYCNATVNEDGATKTAVEGFIDMELKVGKIKKNG